MCSMGPSCVFRVQRRPLIGQMTSGMSRFASRQLVHSHSLNAEIDITASSESSSVQTSELRAETDAQALGWRLRCTISV